jgi:hypothetical protein
MRRLTAQHDPSRYTAGTASPPTNIALLATMPFAPGAISPGLLPSRKLGALLRAIRCPLPST